MRSSGQRKRAVRSRMRKIGAVAALMAVTPWLMASGCDRTAQNAFRDASASSLEDGLKQVFDGVISGIFAAFVLGDNTTTTTSGG